MVRGLDRFRVHFAPFAASYKNDVFRLYRIIDPARQVALPHPIAMDLRQFFAQMETGRDVDLKNLGLKNTSLAEILAQLRSIYVLAV